MAKFRYIGPRTIDGTHVGVELPGRKFATAGNTVKCDDEAKVRRSTKHEKRVLVGRNHVIEVPDVDVFACMSFRLAVGIGGVKLYEEIQ